MVLDPAIKGMVKFNIQQHLACYCFRAPAPQQLVAELQNTGVEYAKPVIL